MIISGIYGVTIFLFKIKDSVFHSYLSGINIAMSIIFFLATIYFIINILSKIQVSSFMFNFKNFQAGLNLNKNDQLFEYYTDELYYLIINSGSDALIIEDLDRANDTDIFDKLRDLNQKINNDRSSKNNRSRFKFIYLIRDTLFEENNTEVKFFDYIIPVVPFISINNSKNKISELFKEYNLDSELIYMISGYLTDYRQIIELKNEFDVYYSIINTNRKININELFSLITYKIIFPKSFSELQKGNGVLNYIDFNELKPDGGHDYLMNIFDNPKHQNKESYSSDEKEFLSLLLVQGSITSTFMYSINNNYEDITNYEFFMNLKRNGKKELFESDLSDLDNFINNFNYDDFSKKQILNNNLFNFLLNNKEDKKNQYLKILETAYKTDNDFLTSLISDFVIKDKIKDLYDVLNDIRVETFKYDVDININLKPIFETIYESYEGIFELFSNLIENNLYKVNNENISVLIDFFNSYDGSDNKDTHNDSNVEFISDYFVNNFLNNRFVNNKVKKEVIKKLKYIKLDTEDIKYYYDECLNNNLIKANEKNIVYYYTNYISIGVGEINQDRFNHLINFINQNEIKFSFDEMKKIKYTEKMFDFYYFLLTDDDIKLNKLDVIFKTYTYENYDDKNIENIIKSNNGKEKLEQLFKIEMKNDEVKIFDYTPDLVDKMIKENIDIDELIQSPLIIKIVENNNIELSEYWFDLLFQKIKNKLDLLIDNLDNIHDAYRISGYLAKVKEMNKEELSRLIKLFSRDNKGIKQVRFIDNDINRIFLNHAVKEKIITKYTNSRNNTLRVIIEKNT